MSLNWTPPAFHPRHNPIPDIIATGYAGRRANRALDFQEEQARLNRQDAEDARRRTAMEQVASQVETNPEAARMLAQIHGVPFSGGDVIDKRRPMPSYDDPENMGGVPLTEPAPIAPPSTIIPSQGTPESNDVMDPLPSEQPVSPVPERQVDRASAHRDPYAGEPKVEGQEAEAPVQTAEEAQAEAVNPAAYKTKQSEMEALMKGATASLKGLPDPKALPFGGPPPDDALAALMTEAAPLESPEQMAASQYFPPDLIRGAQYNLGTDPFEKDVGPVRELQGEDTDFVQIRSPYNIGGITYDPMKAKGQRQTANYAMADAIKQNLVEAPGGNETIGNDTRKAARTLAALTAAGAPEGAQKFIDRAALDANKANLATDIANQKADIAEMRAADERARREVEAEQKRLDEQGRLARNSETVEGRKEVARINAASRGKGRGGSLRLNINAASGVVGEKEARRITADLHKYLANTEYKDIAGSEWRTMAMADDVNSDNPARQTAAMGEFATMAQSRKTANRLTEKDYQIFAKNIGGIGMRLETALSEYLSGNLAGSKKAMMEKGLREWAMQQKSRLNAVKAGAENIIDADRSFSPEQKAGLKDKWIGSYFGASRPGGPSPEKGAATPMPAGVPEGSIKGKKNGKTAYKTPDGRIIVVE